jgi:predicted porin
MNKKLVAVAVAAGLALPMVSAHAVDVADKKLEVYGKLHVSLSSIDAAGTTSDNYLLESNASRLGFKGAIPLDGGLTGTYKYEVQADVTDGTLLDSQRNTYLGLKGGFGEVRLGRHDSPLKMAQGKFDQFGDTAGDLKNAGSQDGENRNASAITYLGKFDKLAVNVQLIPGEGNGTTGGQGITDTTSIGVSYKAGPLYVAVANDSYDDTGAAASTDSSMTRIVATYKMGNMQLGLLSQSGVESVTASTNKEDWLGLSFSMKVGSNNKFKVQHITTEDDAAVKTEVTQTTVGFDHKLGKKGTVYAMFNTYDETGTANDKDTLSVGYVLKF